MEITDSIKKAPRWAWYTAGGVAVGAGAIRLYKNRTTSDGTTPSESDAATAIGGDPYAASGGGASPTLVPSVIVTGTGNGGSDASSGVAAGIEGFSAIIDGTTGLIGTLEGFFNPIVLEQASTIHDQILQQGSTIHDTVVGLIANAGSPPQPQQQNPSVINVYTPPEASAPAAPVATVSTVAAMTDAEQHEIMAAAVRQQWQNEAAMRAAADAQNGVSPRIGTQAGNDAMIAAWMRANPGKVFPG